MNQETSPLISNQAEAASAYQAQLLPPAESALLLFLWRSSCRLRIIVVIIYPELQFITIEDEVQIYLAVDNIIKIFLLPSQLAFQP